MALPLNALGGKLMTVSSFAMAHGADRRTHRDTGAGCADASDQICKMLPRMLPSMAVDCGYLFELIDIIGAGWRIRTPDLLITNQIKPLLICRHNFGSW